MKIYVIRHGLTELNKKKKVNGQIDEPLALEGIKQAKAAVSLIPKEVKYIYTSPMLRARQTAEIISSKLNLPISISEELTEIHMGSLAGNAWEEIPNGRELKEKHRTGLFDYRSDGGESVQEVKTRLIKFLKKVKGTYKNKEVLLITHGGIIRLLYTLEHKKPLTVEKIEHVYPHLVNLNKILK